MVLPKRQLSFLQHTSEWDLSMCEKDSDSPLFDTILSSLCIVKEHTLAQVELSIHHQLHITSQRLTLVPRDLLHLLRRYILTFWHTHNSQWIPSKPLGRENVKSDK